MTKDVEGLLKKLPKESRFNHIVQDVLLTEMDRMTCVSASNIVSEFRHFGAIYAFRHDHLLKCGIEHYGILESIENMRMNPGPKRTAHLQTTNFELIVWMEPDLSKITGLVVVAKKGGNQRDWEIKGDRHERDQ